MWVASRRERIAVVAVMSTKHQTKKMVVIAVILV